jgi:hypothetical protein
MPLPTLNPISPCSEYIGVRRFLWWGLWLLLSAAAAHAEWHINVLWSRAGYVDLNVYDVTGRLVRCLAGGCNPPLQAGKHQIAFDGSDLSSGIYFVRMEAGGMAQTRKIVLLK